LTFDEAKRLTVSVFKGASELAERSEQALGTLIENVASKGGTTAAALKVFAERGVAEAIRDGVSAAVERSAELGK
jgi:pyrroline-5-carboxylate reductase